MQSSRHALYTRLRVKAPSDFERERERDGRLQNDDKSEMQYMIRRIYLKAHDAHDDERMMCDGYCITLWRE